MLPAPVVSRCAFKGTATMVRSWVGWAAGWLAVAGIAGASGVSAAEDPAEKVLKDHGLSRARTVYVIEAESEVKSKLAEARSASDQLKSVHAQQDALEENAARIQQLTEQSNQLRQGINAYTMQMANTSRYGRGMYRNFNPATAQRNQLMMNLNLVTGELNRLKLQAPTPKKKQELNDEAQHRREDILQAVHDLRQLVDSTTQKYDELGQNSEVKDALATLGRSRKVNLKLGPSREFLDTVKLLEKLEKSAQTRTREPRTKTSRKSKNSSKSKQQSPLN
jgi:hypothetical protein